MRNDITSVLLRRENDDVIGGNNPARLMGMPLKSRTTPLLRSTKPRGRPRTHTESWAKVSVVLFERQILRLDRLSTQVRRKKGHPLTRAQIIRALVDGLLHSELDVTAHASEAELRAYVARCLSSPQRQNRD